MATIIVLGLSIWGIVALIRGVRKRAKQREMQRMERIRAEQNRRRAEVQEELKRMRIEAKAEADRMALVIKEQMRQQKEQERIAKEQARQAEQLAKHEERIAKLEQQVKLAEREIEHYQPIVNELRQQAEDLSLKIRYYESKGLLCGGYKTELEKINEKLYKTENKIIKAEFSKQTAQQKLTA